MRFGCPDYTAREAAASTDSQLRLPLVAASKPYNRGMAGTFEPLPREEANRLLLERVEAWKRFERESDASRWRDATDAERAKEVHELCRAADRMMAAAGVTFQPEKRKFPRLDRIIRKP